MDTQDNSRLKAFKSTKWMIITTVVYSIIALIILPRHWMANDNYSFIRDIEGGFPTVFFSPVLGKALSILYINISDSIAWYGIFIYVCHLLSQLIIVYTISKLHLPTFYKWVLFGISTLLYTRFIYATGYNSAAILLTGSSSFLFLTLVTKKENTKWLIYCLLGLLLALAYLIRSKALIGTFIFLTPAIFIYMLYSKVRFNKGWVFFIIPLLLGVSAHKMYISFCTDHQYKNFIEWNSGRGKFHDFHIQELQRNNTEFFLNSDWSRLDYELLDEWYIFDENIFNTRSINQLLDYPVPQELILSSQLDLTASKLMRYDWQNFISICTLVISTIALVSMLKTENTGLLSRLNLYYFLLVGAAMTYFMRFPERIAFPFAYITLLSILALSNLDSFHSMKITKLKKCLVSTLLVFSIVLYFYNFTHNIKEDKREIDTFYRGNTLLNHYIDRYNYVAMYPSNANLKWQFADPLKVYNENFISIPGGWPAFSPRFYSSINDLDLNHGHELFPRIVNGEHVLVIATRYRISLLTQYLSVQLGIECDVEYKGSIGNFANMYELHPATK